MYIWPCGILTDTVRVAVLEADRYLTAVVKHLVCVRTPDPITGRLEPALSVAWRNHRTSCHNRGGRRGRSEKLAARQRRRGARSSAGMSLLQKTGTGRILRENVVVPASGERHASTDARLRTCPGQRRTWHTARGPRTPA